MAHWSDYSLRGWLSFLAFMHIGIAIRAFFDTTFVYEKVLTPTPNMCKESVLIQLFGTYSIGQAFILIQAAIHLYVLPVQIITIFFLVLFISFVIAESFIFHIWDFYGGTLLPFVMSVISLIVIIVFHFIWKPWLHFRINEDNNLKSMFHEGKKKCKANSQQHHHRETHYSPFNEHYLKRH